MNTIDQEALRVEVEAGMQRQKRITRWSLFGVSIGLFILFLIIAIVGFVSGAGQTIPEGVIAAIILPFTGWLLSIVYQGILLGLDTKMAEDQMRGQIVGRVLGRQLVQQNLEAVYGEKPKRQLEDAPSDEIAYEVGDDGELRRAERSGRSEA